MLRKQLEKLIDKMYKHAETPSQVVLDVQNFESYHAGLMLKKFGKYIGYFEHGFDILVNLVFLINYLEKKVWPKHRSLQFLLLKNNLSPLYSAFDRLIKGFYVDATILLRTPYEAFIKMLYISYYPSNPYITILSKSHKGIPKFNLTDFLKNDLKVNWDFIYRMSSSFSHSYNFPTLHEAIEIHQQGQKNAICFELKFDEKMLSIPMNFSLFLLWCLTKISVLLFVDLKDKKMDPKLYTKFITTEKAFGAIIMTMPNKWATTFNDLSRILQETKKREGIK